MIKNKIFFIIIASLFISIISSIIINSNLNDRYIQKIVISKIDPTESVSLAILEKEFYGNVLSGLTRSFAESLNQEVYDKSNLDCAEINRINDILPIVISNDSLKTKIEIISNNSEHLRKCAEFVFKKVDNKNIELRQFINNLVKKSGGIRSNINQKFKAKANIQDVIDGLNAFEKKLIDNTSLEKDDAKDFLKVWLMDLIDKNDNQNETINLDDIKKLDYLQITSNKIIKKEKLSVYTLAVGLFFISLLIIIIFFKGFNNKKLIKGINNILK